MEPGKRLDPYEVGFEDEMIAVYHATSHEDAKQQCKDDIRLHKPNLNTKPSDRLKGLISVKVSRGHQSVKSIRHKHSEEEPSP